VILRGLLLAVPLLLLADTPTTYTIQTVAGTDFVGDGGVATTAILSQPEGIAVDAAGNIYVADADDNRVRRISTSGVIQTIAGTGHAGFSGDGGPGSSAQINQPYGLALDAAGNLYIADLGNARVRKITKDGNIATIAGGGMTAVSSTSASLAATSAALNAPRNVALDPAGNLYVSDFGANQVYVISTAGLLSVFAGSGTAGGSGDGASATQAELSSPAGLACDSSGNVYIADSGNGRIRSVAQGIINTVFSITSPTGLAVNNAGTLYFAAPGYFGTIALSLGSGISARDVAVDASGNLYLTSGLLVQELAVNGTLSIVAGSGAARYYGGDGGPATMARLHLPSGVALDDLGNAYIADTANNRIRMIMANGTMTTFAGTGESGTGDGSGIAMAAQFNGPSALAIDSHRDVYVADTGNNRVCMITQEGVLTVVADQLAGPEAIAIDSNDNLYIGDTGNDRVLELTANEPSAVIGQVLKPAGLAVDSKGTLYISESNRLSKIVNGVVTTVLDGLNQPEGLAVTGTGDVVVVETGNQRVLLVQGGTATPIAGSGTAGFGGDGGPAAVAEFNSPAGVALDGLGNLWVADAGNNRIRMLTPTVSTVATESLAPVTVVNAASQATGAIAPGEIVCIFGAGFDPVQTQVLFAGKPTTLFYTSATQINALVPALTPGPSVDLMVVVDGATVSDMQAPVVAAAPGIFTSANNDQAAVLNQDGSYNSANNPAARGSYVSVFATGWSDPTLAVGLTIGGYNATVLYAGPAPEFVGLMQINVQVPAGFLGPGTQSLLLSVGNATSQAGPTIALQ
jgi:uncharacterized protein (TIGR03437 family)